MALHTLIRLALVVVALAAWEAGSRLAEAVYFPPPSVIAAKTVTLWVSPEGAADVLPSLARLGAGWAVAAAAGVALGLAIGRSRTLADLTGPLVHFGRSVPPAALLPLFLLFFPIGSPVQIAAIVYGVLWPVLINTADGARFVDRQYLETARVFRMGRAQQLWRIILPAAAPKIFAGLRLSVSLALIMMVISELYASTEGIGHRMREAEGIDIPALWAAIVLLGLLGIVLNSGFLLVEARLLAWHRGAHAER
ncbi:ABC transporter permease subunit [Nonomuraea sp. NPDC050310]|uniref:ABC transporter permease n=1 Tax=unclassified Nonomuraea TaxID=2593643 RepID=UPI0033F65ACE